MGKHSWWDVKILTRKKIPAVVGERIIAGGVIYITTNIPIYFGCIFFIFFVFFGWPRYM